MAERLAALASIPGPIPNDYAPADDTAGLGSRILAYLLDSLALFAFIIILFVGPAAFLLIQRTDSGHFSDSTEWMLVGILLATIPCWLLVNLALLSRRGQTFGQYVIGLRLVAEDGSPPRFKQLLLYWLALHPLLFHPFFGGFWGLVGFLAIALLGNTPVFLGTLAVAILCLVAGPAGALFALLDPQRRALHDRIAGLKLVRLA